MEQIFNDELKMTFPEGFRELNADEMKNLTFIKEGPGSCFKDEGRHIIVSIAWKKAGLLGGLADPAEAVKSMEKQVAGPMKEYGYVLEGFSERTVGESRLYGFRYDYKVQDIAMTGESYILKKDRTFYYLHAYYRSNSADGGEIWNGILDSINYK